MDAAFAHAADFLAGLEQRPVAAVADLATLRARFSATLPTAGLAPKRVVEELVHAVDDGLHGSAGGRFFGWVIGGALPAALAVDWLTAAWDQNAALYSTAPAAAVVEEVVGRWLVDLLALPPDAGFALVTGSQMAHVTCLAAARHAVLAARGWDVEKQGLFGAPPIRLLLSGARHGSVDRAVSLLGLGRDHVVPLVWTARRGVEADDLERQLKKNAGAPTIVALQAGEINSGVYDDFATLIPLAREHGAWVHVDGAIGLWAAVSPRLRHLVKGIGKADSWVTDGHKWLNTPYDCGFAFIADAQAQRAALSHRASYLTHDSEARDQIDWNPEWSRRARGFAAWAALRQLGKQGLAELIEGCVDHTTALVVGLGALPGVEILCRPTINQGVVRFRSPVSTAGEAEHDRETDRVIAAVLETGEAFFTGTTYEGRRAMRISVSSWMTSNDDVARVLRAVARVLDQRQS